MDSGEEKATLSQISLVRGPPTANNYRKVPCVALNGEQTQTGGATGATALASKTACLRLKKVINRSIIPSLDLT